MNESADTPSPEQQMYWREFVQLKADSCYDRDYRNSLGKWVTGVAVIRAITSTGSIGAWLIWKKYTYVWAFLIATSQVMEALKGVFPVYKRRRVLSQWSRALNQLFVEAQRSWDGISSGEYTNAEIRKLCHQLRSRKNRAEAKHIPDGLNRRADLFNKAQIEAKHFFNTRYNLSEE
jgi:hypothetical protein